jgi:DNA polymerase III sliding clamp (beta) subunit (PCNA family)
VLRHYYVTENGGERMKVQREKLLHQLELVSPGLSTRDIIEQSASVIFKDGKVVTFNDEVACSIECGLSVEGAVRADPLLGILRKMPDEEIEVKTSKTHLKLRGSGRGADVVMDDEIKLDIDIIEHPSKWRRLPKKFLQAVSVTKECISRDESKQRLVHLHIRPDAIESSDNYQASRFTLTTKFSAPALIKRTSAFTIEQLGPEKFAETDTWVHFRNAEGLDIACRRYDETYPNLDPFLEVEGEDTELPEGLEKICDRAEEFSKDNPDDNQVKVSLKKGELKVVGEGVYGRFFERRRVPYKGSPISFLIPPKLLATIGKRHNRCIVSDERLKVEDGNFVYATALGEEEK